MFSTSNSIRNVKEGEGRTHSALEMAAESIKIIQLRRLLITINHLPRGNKIAVFRKFYRGTRDRDSFFVGEVFRSLFVT